MRIVILLFCLLSGSFGFASENLLQLTRTITMPANIVHSEYGVSQYTITNHFGFDLPGILLINLPSGVSATTGPGYCNFPQALANNASCVLRLTFSGAISQAFNDSDFQLCPDSSHTGCSHMSSQQQNITTVISSPTTDMPNLTASLTHLLLGPNEISEITIHNASNTVIANGVHIELPTFIQQHLNSASVTACDTILPQGNCTLTLDMNSDLPVAQDDVAIVTGGNTYPLMLPVQTVNGNVDISNVVLEDTAAHEITITNHNASAINVTNITLADSLHNVTVGAIPQSCQNLANSQSCTVSIAATVEAYGNGNINVTMQGSGIGTLTKTATVTVANTKVVINPTSGQSTPIIGASSGGTFTVTNTGNYTWQAPQITADSNDTWLQLNGCTTALAPDASCTVTYSYTSGVRTMSTITAAGANIQATHVNFEPAAQISVGIEASDAHQHLGYRAIKLVDHSAAITLTNVVDSLPSTLTNKLEVCDATGSNCLDTYASDCLTPNKQLSKGESCHVWYKALPTTSLGSVTADYTFSVEADAALGQKKTISRQLQLSYENDLYAGGYLKTAGGKAAQHIAKWDGSTWYGVDKGANAVVYSVYPFNGDLYIGGSFNAAGNSRANVIAKWNGQSWQPLGKGLQSAASSSNVVSMVSANNNLYVGGSFSTAGTIPANNIAAWNGTSWAALGSGITGLGTSLTVLNKTLYTIAGRKNILQWDPKTSEWNPPAAGAFNTYASAIQSLYTILGFNNDLYVGGSFYMGSSFSSSTHGSIAKTTDMCQKGVDQCWSELGNGTSAPGYISNLTSLGTSLYAIGQFSKIDGQEVNNIATWNGVTWSALDAAGLSASGSAMISLGDKLYVGGTFTQAGGITVNYIALWDPTTSTWSALGTGTNTGVSSTVFSLAIAPQVTITSKVPLLH